MFTSSLSFVVTYVYTEYIDVMVHVGYAVKIKVGKLQYLHSVVSSIMINLRDINVC